LPAIPHPAYHASAMDGVAVLSRDTFGADEMRPITLKLGEQAHLVNTGHVLPEGCDAVIKIEDVHQPDEKSIEIRAAAFPWQHVRKVGEDMVAQEMMLPHHHHFIRATDIAALLTAGVFEIKVLKKPKVAVIPTGSELITWQDAMKSQPGAGSIIETNSTLLAGMIQEAGGEPMVWPLQKDDFESIKSTVAEALESEAHMVMLNAGASAGSKDYSVHVFKELGDVLIHGVAVMPGKPSILAKANSGKPMIGTPGYAVSAWVCIDQFVAPALAAMQGKDHEPRQQIEVIPARPLPSKLGQEEFLRVHLGRVGKKVVATPLKRGAGTITSLTRADGIVRIPSRSEGVSEGQPTVAELLVSRRDVDHTLVVVGSHDVTLDILADHMARRSPGLRMSSSHVGSLAGLMALRQGRSHMGGSHLLDAETGDYNVSYLKRFMPETPARLVSLALRHQGFMVAPGNPKGIKKAADLIREDVRMVNRQAGSGTRVLLDYHLDQEGINPADIRGYGQEEYTHMAVAVQVLSGGADVGLGILAAAMALDLEFIPLMQERYDLVIPLEHWHDKRIKILLETLQEPAFKKAVQGLGGYDISIMGNLAWEG
jgi:molybdenum cofactor synthesis domain-containing protein